MIRIIGTRLLVPKGDTGFFTLPTRGIPSKGDVAVFSVKDPLTRTTIIEKIIDASEYHLLIEFEHEDTMNLETNVYEYEVLIVTHSGQIIKPAYGKINIKECVKYQ